MGKESLGAKGRSPTIAQSRVPPYMRGFIDRPPLRPGSPIPRRGARVVDWGGLENRCARKGTVGSNPTLSASHPPKFCSVPLRPGTALVLTPVEYALLVRGDGNAHSFGNAHTERIILVEHE